MNNIIKKICVLWISLTVIFVLTFITFQLIRLSAIVGGVFFLVMCIVFFVFKGIYTTIKDL